MGDVERKIQLKHLYEYWGYWTEIWRPLVKPKPSKEKRKALKKRIRLESFKHEDKSE